MTASGKKAATDAARHAGATSADALVELAKSALSTHAYYDATFKCQAMKVLPGEYYVTIKDLMLVTVLGSCVSVCIRDKLLGIGGMNHFMLPSHAESGLLLSPSMRYGTHAMDVLLDQLYQVGARRDRLEIQVFGGAAVLTGMNVLDVGARNSCFILEFLRNEGLPVAAADLFDVHPRKVYFVPATGWIKVRRLCLQG